MPATKKFVLLPGTTARASVFRQDGWSPARLNWTNAVAADDGGTLYRATSGLEVGRDDRLRPGQPGRDVVGRHGGRGLGGFVPVLDGHLDVVRALLHRRPGECAGRAEVAEDVERAAVRGGAELVHRARPDVGGGGRPGDALADENGVSSLGASVAVPDSSLRFSRSSTQGRAARRRGMVEPTTTAGGLSGMRGERNDMVVSFADVVCDRSALPVRRPCVGAVAGRCPA